MLATSESYATSHPAAVRQFLQAVESGQTALSQKQPAALKDIANIYSSGLSPSVIDDSATAGVDTGCSMPCRGLAGGRGHHEQVGLAPAHITASDVSAAYKTGAGLTGTPRLTGRLSGRIRPKVCP